MSVGEEVEKRENKCIPGFLAELFTIAKIWKQSKFTSTDKKMEMCHTHTHTHTHWNTTQLQIRVKFCPLQHGWTWRILLW